MGRGGNRRPRRRAARSPCGHDRRRRRVQRRLPLRPAARAHAPRLPADRQLCRRAIDARRRRRRVAAAPTRAAVVKIAVVGGGGVRTPLLVAGLTASDLPIDEIALYDIDQPRLRVIGAVAAKMAARGRVAPCASLDACLSGADFVFTSIRVGGIERRVRDEAAAQRHGIAGQETVGPAGFAMAARTIPEMVRYARQIARAAPRAWIVNFTNPVGMVTEAMRSETDRAIGICDTPTELFERTAHALGLRPDRCYFDYFGLNHLGWVREVYADGAPQLDRLWRAPERLRAIYKAPLFDADALGELKLLPTEYVYYYDRRTTNICARATRATCGWRPSRRSRRPRRSRRRPRISRVTTRSRSPSSARFTSTPMRFCRSAS
ncbi:MAG: hypothetical protein DMF93_02890 [Acidobacteria bacterium]|nr:MAG: hypothetical protein DMF93_02890 [Acidobacteriota bacterium]